jgi:hypothetical protein
MLIEELKKAKEGLEKTNTINLTPFSVDTTLPNLCITFSQENSYLLQTDIGTWIFNTEHKIMSDKTIISNIVDRTLDLLKHELLEEWVKCPQCNGLGLEKTEADGFFPCIKCNREGKIFTRF